MGFGGVGGTGKGLGVVGDGRSWAFCDGFGMVSLGWRTRKRAL